MREWPLCLRCPTTGGPLRPNQWQPGLRNLGHVTQFKAQGPFCQGSMKKHQRSPGLELYSPALRKPGQLKVELEADGQHSPPGQLGIQVERVQFIVLIGHVKQH